VLITIEQFTCFFLMILKTLRIFFFITNSVIVTAKEARNPSLPRGLGQELSFVRAV
jgi:hypothetical protein